MATVLITGAGRGLGAEFARQYAAAGWRAIGTLRDMAQGAKLPKGVETHLLDVTDRRAIARLAADLADTPIDVLICNSGIYGPRGGPTDYEAWERTMRVNVFGPMAVVEALADRVAASAQKKIVVVSSRMGSLAQTTSGPVVYKSSKAAANMVVRVLAGEFAGKGAIVVAVHPGWVRTDMGGPGAAISPETSVAGLIRVVAGLKREDSGRFLNYDGTEIPW